MYVERRVDAPLPLQSGLSGANCIDSGVAYVRAKAGHKRESTLTLVSGILIEFFSRFENFAQMIARPRTERFHGLP